MAGHCTRLGSFSTEVTRRSNRSLPGPAEFAQQIAATHGSRCPWLSGGKDFNWTGSRPVDPFHRRTDWPSAIHGESRDRAQWRAHRLSSQPCRQCRMGSRASPKAMQTDSRSRAGGHSGQQGASAVVSRADRRRAQAYLSERREPARVAQDHLPKPVHSSARRLEVGTSGTSATNSRYAPLSSIHAKDGWPRADRGRSFAVSYLIKQFIGNIEVQPFDCLPGGIFHVFRDSVDGRYRSVGLRP